MTAPTFIFHLALAQEWAEARASGGPYRRSTLGVSLDEQGFIHCSDAGQLQTVADAFFVGRDDVVLLLIDSRRLTAPVKLEAVDDGEPFPHIYGPLDPEAVLDSVPLELLPDGRLDVDGPFRTRLRAFLQPMT